MCPTCATCILLVSLALSVSVVNPSCCSTVHLQDHLDHSKCIECGQCSTVCPVGAITEHTGEQRAAPGCALQGPSALAGQPWATAVSPELAFSLFAL